LNAEPRPKQPSEKRKARPTGHRLAGILERRGWPTSLNGPLADTVTIADIAVAAPICNGAQNRKRLAASTIIPSLKRWMADCRAVCNAGRKNPRRR